MAGEKTESGHWPIGVDKIEAPKADVAAGGHTESESDIGARSHRFLFIKESARLSPYLARQLSVFCKQPSEFIRVSCYFRKTMVALKDIRSYTGSG